jgi:RNA-directed DNA polymerase
MSNTRLQSKPLLRQKPMVEWKDTNWRKLERVVFKLQKRIYRATQRGDVKAVRKLQKTLMRSWSAKCLAVRKVTQDNQGKKTAGVDGVKSLTPLQRLELVSKLSLNRKVKPTRRVWIPKPGNEEKRPLGIPTMYDRALQALVKQTIEPEWEARFEPNSYGFRPGRSCHDAIEAIFTIIAQKSRYVLDADISKCFDCINHKALLEKLNTFPTIRRQIRAWLKAGVIDKGVFSDTSEGTPQGGVISPLLANIALHGMENRIKQVSKNAFLIRYADDFLVLHENLSVVEKCQEVIAEWLKGMGLELKPSKTRLTHTLNEYEEQKPGFDFLGFNIRQYPVGKYQSGKNNGTLLGFKTLIKPSKKKIKIHAESLRSVIKTHKAAPQEALINRLNPIIRGWANYYSTVVSKEILSGMDKLIYQQLKAWSNFRHPNKDSHWIARRYWLIEQGEGWVFASRKEGNKKMRLIKHSETPIVRHIKVRGDCSPYDGDWIYWSTRMGMHPEAATRVSKLLKKQKGKCTHCELFFKNGDLLEIDHKKAHSKGGKNTQDNLQLLHRHCHDTKTANDDKAVRGTNDNSQIIEEPCEVKVSRTVL